MLTLAAVLRQHACEILVVGGVEDHVVGSDTQSVIPGLRLANTFGVHPYVVSSPFVRQVQSFNASRFSRLVINIDDSSTNSRIAGSVPSAAGGR